MGFDPQLPDRRWSKFQPTPSSPKAHKRDSFFETGANWLGSPIGWAQYKKDSSRPRASPPPFLVETGANWLGSIQKRLKPATGLPPFLFFETGANWLGSTKLLCMDGIKGNHKPAAPTHMLGPTHHMVGLRLTRAETNANGLCQPVTRRDPPKGRAA